MESLFTPKRSLYLPCLPALSCVSTSITCCTVCIRETVIVIDRLVPRPEEK